MASRLECDATRRRNRGYGIRVLTFRESQVSRDTRLVAGTLMAAVAFVLLIACANLANLLLVRGAARQREMAVRAAMGASRARLAWVLLGESAVLAVAGTVLGMLGAAWALDLMRASFPEELPYWIRLDVDVRVVLFTARITVFTTLAIGLLPALRASRPRVVEDLEGRRPRRHARPSRAATADRAGRRAGRPVPGTARRREPHDPQLPVAAARGHRLRRWRRC